ncbi:MAG: hypothetical protein ABI767_08690 [Rhodanobacter sp.]
MGGTHCGPLQVRHRARLKGKRVVRLDMPDRYDVMQRSGPPCF